MTVICSCNFLTDVMIKEYMENHEGQHPSPEMILKSLEKNIVCATCARSIKCEIRKHMEAKKCLEAERSILAEDLRPVSATSQEKELITGDIGII